MTVTAKKDVRLGLFLRHFLGAEPDTQFSETFKPRSLDEQEQAQETGLEIDVKDWKRFRFIIRPENPHFSDIVFPDGLPVYCDCLNEKWQGCTPDVTKAVSDKTYGIIRNHPLRWVYNL